MEGSSRRSFLLGMLGLALSGCAGGASRLIYDEEYLRALTEENLGAERERLAREALSADLKPLPRSAWAPYPPIENRLQPMNKIHRITVHHEGSDMNTSTTSSTVIADLQDIRRVHMRTMHAGDIGYHYIIDRTGKIWEGRPIKYQGAHCRRDANTGNLGIMLLGNFDLQKPSAQQLAILDRFLDHQMKCYSVPMRSVFTHRELRPTRCPGTHLQSHMNRVRHA